MMNSGWKPTYVPSAVAPKGPGDWTPDVQAAQLLAREPENDMKLSAWHMLADPYDPQQCRDFDEMLRIEWGWGIDHVGAAIIPHWSPDGNLTGVKVRRPSGSRYSYEGSKYEAMYGCWLGKHHSSVLVTAGETDAVWAAFFARAEGVNVDIRAVPGGEKPPSDAQINQLRGWRTVYLALDPDPAGVAATRAWIDAFATAGFQDVRLCRLPLGRDLRDAKPLVSTLLSQARGPLEAPQNIAPTDRGFEVTDGQGNTRVVSHWTIDPIARLEGGDEPGLKIRLIERRGETEDHIRWSDLTSIQRLKNWAAARSLTFSGSDRDLTLLSQHVKWQSTFVPEIIYTDRIGLHVPPDAYGITRPTFVLPHGDYIGDMPWDYAPSPKKADVTDDVLLPGDGGSFEWPWLDALLNISTDPAIGHTLVAWAIASARRTEVANFPLLFIGGSSGAGKSTLANLVLRLMGSKIATGLGSVTPYVLMQRLAATSSLPVFVDEWTRLSRHDSRLALQGLIPDIYAGATSERGQSDLVTVRYRMTSPVLVAGEDTMHLDRELERLISVFPRRKNQRPEMLAQIATKPLERFGLLVHTALARGGVDFAPLVPEIQPTRPLHNQAVLDGGWATLHALLDFARSRSEDVPDVPAMRAQPDPADVGPAEENVYESAIRECAGLRPDGLPLVWPDSLGRGTVVRFGPLVKAADRFLDLELPGRSVAMRDYFTGRFAVKDIRVRNVPAKEIGIGDTALPYPLRAHLIEGFYLDTDDERKEVTA